MNTKDNFIRLINLNNNNNKILKQLGEDWGIAEHLSWKFLIFTKT